MCKFNAIPFQYSISAINETALLVSFENVIDETILEKVMALQQALSLKPFKGLIETVPAYASLAVFYDVATVRKYHAVTSTAFEFVKTFVTQLMSQIDTLPMDTNSAIINIPVYYNGADLANVAKQHQLTAAEVIRIHTQKIVRVFMIGFLPGFAYMGKLDERIATPRLTVPRAQVEPGSVGIAGFQTGIYPLASPGGWQLIGKTPLKIFDTTKHNPCLLKAGDRIQFFAISSTDFERLNEY
jgi:inhibitor of KinA